MWHGVRNSVQVGMDVGRGAELDDDGTLNPDAWEIGALNGCSNSEIV
jgi:hypothetical protein